MGGRALLPEERVAVAEKDISAEVAARGLRLLAAVPGLSTARVEAALNGLAGEPHWKLRYKGGVQDIFFHTTARQGSGLSEPPCWRLPKRTSIRRRTWASISSPSTRAWPITASSASLTIPPTPRETAKLRTLFTKASEQLIAQGAYFSRPYGEWADPVYNRDAQSTSGAANGEADTRPEQRAQPQQALLLRARKRRYHDGT